MIIFGSAREIEAGAADVDDSVTVPPDGPLRYRPSTVSTTIAMWSPAGSVQ